MIQRIFWAFCCAISISALASAAEPPAGNHVVVAGCVVKVIDHVQIPAREAGVLEALLVREGELVTAGQILGRLDSKVQLLEKQYAEHELEAAKKTAGSDINVRFAKKAWEVAKATVARSEAARKSTQGAVSDAEYQEQKLAAEKAQLQIEQSELEGEVAKVTQQAKGAQLGLAEARLERRVVDASIPGVVVEIYKRRGEWLNVGDPIVRVLRVDKLRVEGFVDADAHGANLAGRPVSVAATGPGGRQDKFAGKIVFVSPEIQPVTNQIRIWAEVDNPQLLLRPGARPTMTVELPQGGK